jgi:hypothetical protein
MIERTLDRRTSFDPKSLAYPIRTLVANAIPRSFTWARGPQLDQGTEGACVGYGWSGELGARPSVVTGVDNAFARGLYDDARRVDEWPGEAYEGTSVLAGAKVVAARGYIDEYRWAFGLDDLVLAVGHHGPAVLGVNWRNAMFDPDADGTLHVTGPTAGGHCIYLRGVSIKHQMGRISNSWGPTWGKDGDAFISFADLAILLADEGEACIPVGRHATGHA